MYHNLDFNEGALPPGFDNAFSSASHDKMLVDASSGVYFYGKDFYLSYSVSNLLQSSFNPPVKENFPNNEIRNYYGIGAYKFQVVNKDWKLEPSFFIRKMEGQPAVVDFSTRIFYIQNNWGGVTYRNDGTLALCFGFGSGNIHFSYSYDHTFKGEITQYTYGTHEVGLAFHIQTLSKKIGF